MEHEDYCIKCIEDHEDRLRAIEKNNKLELRVEVLEKYMTGQISIGGSKKDMWGYFFAVMSMIIAIIALALAFLK